MKHRTCIAILMGLLALGPMAGCSSKFVVTKISVPVKNGNVSRARANTQTAGAADAMPRQAQAFLPEEGGVAAVSHSGGYAPGAASGAKKGTLDGLIYSLPFTVVQVTAPVVKKEAREGYFSEFAEVFFLDEYLAGGAVAPGTTGVTFRLDKPGIATMAEPDPKEQYYVKLNRSRWELFRDVTGSLELGETGMLTSGQVTVTNTAPDLTISAASVITGLLTRTAFATPLGGGDVVEQAPPFDTGRAQSIIKACAAILTDPNEKAFFQQIGKTVNNALSRRPEEDQILYCQLRAPIERRPVYDFLKDSNEERRNRLASEFRNAAAAYVTIQNLTDKLNDLISGAPMLPQPTESRTELERLIQTQAEKYFLGKVDKTPWSPAFTVREYDAAVVPLFTIDKKNGVCWIDPAQTAGGVLPNPDFCTGDISRTPPEGSDLVSVELRKVDWDTTASTAEAKFDLKKAGRGFAYRIPAQATVILNRGKSEVGRATVAVAQFGHTASLPASLGGFSTTYTFKLDEATGAMRSASFGRTGIIRKESLDAAGTNLNALLDARRAQLEARKKQAETDAENASVGTDLERRKKLLETQVAVQEACQKLKLDCGILIDSAGNAVKPQ
ncbi:MAG TPA: DUF4831 family protein [Bryobacteraceae bacterium]|jgi:hypothetical protein|nr:DUF4831 family protein [Bryobacteraceae bacterium]